MPKSLPQNPSIRQLKIQAKNLLKAHKSGDVSACDTLKVLHRFSKVTSQNILESTISLKEAQFAIALSYGFKGWKNLKEHIESFEHENTDKDSKEDIEQAHLFEQGEEIRIIDGPYTYFNATVEDVNPEVEKIKVLVSIFNQLTQLELDFAQVSKL